MLFKNFFLLNFFHLEPVKCVSQEDSAILMDNTLCSVQRIYSAFF